MGTSRRHVIVLIAAVATAFALALPAAAVPNAPVVVYQVSGTPSPPADGDSPFAGCDVSGFLLPGETNTVNTEVSPVVAVNPTNPANVIAVYRQDQFSGGSTRGLVAGVSHDGGQSWAATYPPFTICAGGNAGNGGDFQRARDQWVTFGPDGTAYVIGRPIDRVGPDAASAITLSTSKDGGDTWSEPVTLIRNLNDVAPFFFNRSPSVAVDPFDSDVVYALWGRGRKPGDAQSASAEHTFAFRGDTMFSRSVDGGRTWEMPRAIVQYRKNAGTLDNMLGVLPDGTLIDLFDNVGSASHNRNYDIKLIRSTDRGATWSSPTEVAPETATPCRACNGPVDPDTGRPIRVLIGRADIAVDLNRSSPGYGTIYAVWGDTFGSPKKNPYSTIVFTQSTDGGLTWSAPIKVNKSPAGVEGFTPEIDVAADGTVAVTYYDLRNNTPDPGVPTDFWMIRCQPASGCTDVANWNETHVAGPFDVERAPNFGGYYLGDYTGLASIGTSFVTAFAQTSAADSANTYLGVVTP